MNPGLTLLYVVDKTFFSACDRKVGSGVRM